MYREIYVCVDVWINVYSCGYRYVLWILDFRVYFLNHGNNRL